jgi:hypothetical protein
MKDPNKDGNVNLDGVMDQLNNFIRDTVTGWIRGTFRITFIKPEFATRRRDKSFYKNSVTTGAADYVNLINDVMFDKVEDPYLKEIIDNFEKQFAGTPGCFFHFWSTFTHQAAMEVAENFPYTYLLDSDNELLMLMMINSPIVVMLNELSIHNDKKIRETLVSVKKNCANCGPKHQIYKKDPMFTKS